MAGGTHQKRRDLRRPLSDVRGRDPTLAESPSGDETGSPAWRFPANQREFATYAASLSEEPDSAGEVRQRVCALLLSLGDGVAAEASAAGCKPVPEGRD